MSYSTPKKLFVVPDTSEYVYLFLSNIVFTL